MSYSKYFNTLGLTSLAFAVGLIAFPFNCIAFSVQPQVQQQSQQTPPPPPAPPQSSQPASQPVAPTDQPAGKQRKVWTNDELILLRTAADNYLEEKEARAASEAEAAAKLAAQPKASKDTPLEISLPTSIEETQLMIKNKKRDISDAQAVLASLNAELASVPEEQKKAKEKEINIVTGELDRAQSELKELQDHLLQLQKPPVSETPAPPPPSN